MTLTVQSRIAFSDTLLGLDLRDLEITSGPGGLHLYAGTGANGGITGFSLGADGAATAINSVYYGVSGPSVGRLSLVDLGNSGPQLILDGAGAGRMIRHQIETDGALKGAGTIDLPGQGSETHSALAAAALTGGRTALYTADSETGEITAYQADTTGKLTGNAALKGQAGKYDLSGAVTLEVASVGAKSFLLAADTGTNGVRAYKIGKVTGALSPTDTAGASEGLGISAPTALETVTAFGATWVVLGAAGSGSLSVMELSATGRLTPTDHILDSLATRFAGVTALKVVQAGGQVFVVAGGADDGISLFSLLPGGRLLHRETLAHDTGRGLENITALDAVEIGGTLHIYAASGTAGGLGHLTLDLSTLGDVIDPQTAVPMLAGTGADDVLLARGAGTVLRGKGGDDILIAGEGGAVLTGGAGGDTFVLGPSETALRITDFEAGTDLLDMTGFAMLRSPGQLATKALTGGIELTFGTTTIRVFSEDGAPLTLADLWPTGGFDTPDRIPLPSGPVETLTVGTAASDSFTGAGGHDTIRGLGGADTLSGRAGDDTLQGGAGDDLARGGRGFDVLKGEAGHDTLQGGGARDMLYGGKGRDILNGQTGNDRLTGGGGADQFRFAENHGTDRITDFDTARDTIRLKIAGLDFAGLDIRAMGADTVIDTGQGSITLSQLAPSSLEADHFLFV